MVTSPADDASGNPNPQLSSDPYFSYPTPSPEDIERDFPPYREAENIALGLILERFAKKGNHDLGMLLHEVLPRVSSKERPKQVIEFAKVTRQALLKYLAILRWKTSVDVPSSSQPITSLPDVASWPTPHSYGDPNDSPPSLAGKGKGKPAKEVSRGKVTDGRRIQTLLEHQNYQQDEAVNHLKSVSVGIESLRERNPDLLTALTLLSTGTYSGLPSSLVDDHVPKPPLTNGAVLAILKRLNRHLRYRVRTTDYIPPQMEIEDIRDGRLYARGNGWRADLTVVSFEKGGRWWLTGVEWTWKEMDEVAGDTEATQVAGKEKAKGKRFKGEERDNILLLGQDVLAPRQVAEDDKSLKESSDGEKAVDAPLVRLCNLLQHLSLSYQLEVLFSQAIALSRGKWRGQLIPELNRETKTLRLQYWIRERPAQGPRAEQAAVGKKPPPPTTRHIHGGSISISLVPTSSPLSTRDEILGPLFTGGAQPAERVVDLKLAVKWTVGEAGGGGGLKNGDVMDSSMLQLDQNALNIETLLNASTQAHASHLTNHFTSSFLTSAARTALSEEPVILPSQDPKKPPMVLKIPMPSRNDRKYLSVGVSSLTGQLELEDDGASFDDPYGSSSTSSSGPSRAERTKLAEKAVREGRKLMEEVTRLIAAVVLENLRDQLMDLGYTVLSRLGMRSRDLAKASLPPSTLFLPLPSSPSHYFAVKVLQTGIDFELIKIVRVPSDDGIGVNIVVGDKTGIDLGRLRRRRLDKEADGGKVNGQDREEAMVWEVADRDLKELYTLSNAIVSQTLVEQQLKNLHIPYTQLYPPSSGPAAPTSPSALAGMIPTICVDVKDLLKGGKGGEAAAEVACPKVWFRIERWWTGGKVEVETVVVLRRQPSVQTPVSSDAKGKGKETAAQAERITFDPDSSIVRFRAKEIEKCVPEFLEQWERLSKVIAVAGEVNRLHNLDAFADVKMLSFDLCTVTLEYRPGYCAAITYTPTDDSYQVSFSLSPSTSTSSPEESTEEQTEEENPHVLLAPLLSAKLNELTSDPDRQKGTVGREFVSILRSTLPVLLVAKELKSRLRWGLVVLGVGKFRLLKDHNGKRYGLDLNLLPDLERHIIQDSATPHLNGSSNGPLTQLPLFTIIQTVYTAEKSLPTPSPPTSKEQRYIPPLIRLDKGMSLICETARLERLLKSMAEEIEKIVVGEVDQ